MVQADVLLLLVVRVPVPVDVGSHTRPDSGIDRQGKRDAKADLGKGSGRYSQGETSYSSWLAFSRNRKDKVYGELMAVLPQPKS